MIVVKFEAGKIKNQQWIVTQWEGRRVTIFKNPYSTSIWLENIIKT